MNKMNLTVNFLYIVYKELVIAGQRRQPLEHTEEAWEMLITGGTTKHLYA